MADLVSLDFEGKTVGLTVPSLHKSTIARFFNVHENGLHLKASRNGKIENVWPSSNGKFLLPPGTTNATVIAFSAEEYQDEEYFSPSTFGFRYVLSNFFFRIFHDPFLSSFLIELYALGNQALALDIL